MYMLEFYKDKRNEIRKELEMNDYLLKSWLEDDGPKAEAKTAYYIASHQYLIAELEDVNEEIARYEKEAKRND